ncbi:MAG: hypothetical protein NT068_02790 [Candidatus Nomurabacteria bacterium]|nr:hypothetical protein [Candidatus Nomurabacteria bacterium]
MNNLIEQVASLIHESWRKGRYNSETNSYAPRIKIVQDQEWINKHDGINELDIANSPFSELPADWQQENILSATVAIEKIKDALFLIHDNWLDRNDTYADPDQKVQYSRLSKDEKNKDIEVLEDTLKVMRAMEK